MKEQDPLEPTLDQLTDLENVVKNNKGSISNYTINLSRYVWFKSENLRDAVDLLITNWGFKLNPLKEL